MQNGKERREFAMKSSCALRKGEGVQGNGKSECTVQQTWLSAGYDAYLPGTGTLMS